MEFINNDNSNSIKKGLYDDKDIDISDNEVEIVNIKKGKSLKKYAIISTISIVLLLAVKVSIF